MSEFYTTVRGVPDIPRELYTQPLRRILNPTPFKLANVLVFWVESDSTVLVNGDVYQSEAVLVPAKALHPHKPDWLHDGSDIESKRADCQQVAMTGGLFVRGGSAPTPEHMADFAECDYMVALAYREVGMETGAPASILRSDEGRHGLVLHKNMGLFSLGDVSAVGAIDTIQAVLSIDSDVGDVT